MDLGQDGADVLLQGDRRDLDARRVGDGVSGRAARDLRRAQGGGHGLVGEVGQLLDPSRVARGHGDAQRVGGEDRSVLGVVGGPGGVQPGSVGDQGHGAGVGGGEDVGGGAGDDLGGEGAAAGEAQLDVDTGVAGLELPGECGEDVGEGGGGQDGERA
ncbi:hypothetical protein BJF83_10730 [Nocardiopsis sp. CNR-923]|nr:hypothetical protein BJF83_10730 [Nocardiopsis sp. CNR-923]